MSDRSELETDSLEVEISGKSIGQNENSPGGPVLLEQVVHR